jgi:hypothetical protein
MDQDRAIRFAVPPFFLFASLLWGAHLAGCHLSWLFQPDIAKELLGLLAAAAVAVPVGFLIGTLTLVVLRAMALVAGTPTYEAKLSDQTFDNIWKQLKTSQGKDKKWTLYAAATFDHELLPEGIHKWLLRRWNAFNVSAHAIVALLLAHALAPIFPIQQSCQWWGSTLAVAALLLVNALFARRETMRMVEFQSYRKQKGSAKKDAQRLEVPMED